MTVEQAARTAAEAINTALATARRHGPTAAITNNAAREADAAWDDAIAAGATDEQIRAARRR